MELRNQGNEQRLVFHYSWLQFTAITLISHGAAKFIRRMNEQTASGVPSGTNEGFYFGVAE